MSWLSSFFGTSSKPAAVKSDSFLDAVLFAASLASNPAEIDPVLDRVRTLTAHLQPGQPLSPADEAMLVSIYLEIEQYLTTKEPARIFTKEDVRAYLGQRFREAITKKETRAV